MNYIKKVSAEISVYDYIKHSNSTRRYAFIQSYVYMIAEYKSILREYGAKLRNNDIPEVVWTASDLISPSYGESIIQYSRNSILSQSSILEVSRMCGYIAQVLAELIVSLFVGGKSEFLNKEGVYLDDIAVGCLKTAKEAHELGYTKRQIGESVVEMIEALELLIDSCIKAGNFQPSMEFEEFISIIRHDESEINQLDPEAWTKNDYIIGKLSSVKHGRKYSRQMFFVYGDKTSDICQYAKDFFHIEEFATKREEWLVKYEDEKLKRLSFDEAWNYKQEEEEEEE